MNEQIQCSRGPQSMTISLNGEIDNNAVRRLCELIRSGITEYYYTHFILEINSPGGSADALLYFISWLKTFRSWSVEREMPFILETVAIMESCSAAALMLSLGTIGRRTALHGAKILFHTARVAAMSNTQLTGRALQQISGDLNRLDSRVLIELLRHIHQEIAPEVFDLLQDCYCGQAPAGGIIERPWVQALASSSLSGMAERWRQGKPENRANIERKFKSALDRELEKLRKLHTGLDLRRMLDNGHHITFPEATGWLLGQMQHYWQVFDQDRPLAAQEAIDLLLIDQVKEHAPLTALAR